MPLSGDFFSAITVRPVRRFIAACLFHIQIDIDGNVIARSLVRRRFAALYIGIYNENGCQITDNAAKEILSEIEKSPYFAENRPEKSLVGIIGAEI